MPTLTSSVAAEVRALMGRHRVTQGELADAIGRSQSYVSRRLVGDVAFDVDDLERIAERFDVPVADLLHVPSERPRRRVTQPYRDLYALTA